MKTIHAVYENGIFRPTDPVDLPENTAVEVVVPRDSARPPWGEGIRRSAGGWADYPEVDEVMAQIERDRKQDHRPEVEL